MTTIYCNHDISHDSNVELLSECSYHDDGNSDLRLQCVSCHSHILSCSNCGDSTTPTIARIIQISSSNHHPVDAETNATTSSQQRNNNAAGYSIARCSHCKGISLLPCLVSGSFFPSSFLSLLPTPFGCWSLRMAWNIQLSRDADAYIAAKTARYVSLMDEYKTASSSARGSNDNLNVSGGGSANSGSGSGNRSNSPSPSFLPNAQITPARARLLAGAAGASDHHHRHPHRHHDSSSSDAKAGAQPLDHPSSSSADAPMDIANVTSSSSSTPASRSLAALEQRLIHAREHMLQCIEIRERLKGRCRTLKIVMNESTSTEATDDEYEFDLDEGLNEAFTPTHLRMLQLMCQPSNNSSPILSQSFLTMLQQFLQQRSSIRQEQQSLRDASEELQSLRNMNPASLASTNPPSSSSTSASVVSSSALAESTLRIIVNLFECRFQKQALLLKLRLESFNGFCEAINEVLMKLYDALLLKAANAHSISSSASSTHVTHPATVHHSTSASTADSSSLSSILDRERSALLFDRVIHPDLQQDPVLTQLPVEYIVDDASRSKQEQLNHTSWCEDDIHVAIEHLRLLYRDVHATLSLPLSSIKHPGCSNPTVIERSADDVDTHDVNQKQNDQTMHDDHDEEEEEEEEEQKSSYYAASAPARKLPIATPNQSQRHDHVHQPSLFHEQQQRHQYHPYRK